MWSRRSCCSDWRFSEVSACRRTFTPYCATGRSALRSGSSAWAIIGCSPPHSTRCSPVSEPIEGIVNVDRVVHEPARLGILTALDACRSADFMHLQAVTGLSHGNLSLHLGKLEAHGLIEIEKAFIRKKPRTTVR